MIDKFFKLKENNTTILTEFMAGITTFLAMSYIIFVNPAILSESGMDYNAVYAATIITSIIGTLFLGLVANVPYLASAGLGLNSLFTYTLCGSLGFTWQQSLAMVFICGIVNILITATSLRKKIIDSIPEFLKEAITVGIGLFITYVGLTSAGFIDTSGDVPELHAFNDKSIILAAIGLIITAILVVKKKKGAYLWGILITTVIGIPMGVTGIPDFSNKQILPSLAPTFMKMDFPGLFTAKAGFIAVIMTIFTLCLSDLFDTIGVFIGTGKKAKIFTTRNGKMSKKLEKAMFADSIATSIGACFGTSNVTTYVESSAGIEVGGRTGLTAVAGAICFALSLIFAPIVKCVPMAAIAPVLILIGVSTMESIDTIDWKDITIAIPAFFTMIMMPLAYSITIGIEFGFIFYALINLILNKEDNTSPVINTFAIIFIIQFIYQAFA